MHPTHHTPDRPAAQERIASVLCAVTTGCLLAAALVHWWSCEGVC